MSHLLLDTHSTYLIENNMIRSVRILYDTRFATKYSNNFQIKQIFTKEIQTYM